MRLVALQTPLGPEGSNGSEASVGMEYPAPFAVADQASRDIAIVHFLAEHKPWKNINGLHAEV